MRIDGKWLVCDDARVRPVFEGLVRARDDSRVRVLFLADTGADATVFSADIWLALDLPPAKDTIRIEGLGGFAASEMVKTDIKFKTQSGIPFSFKGQFAAITDRLALDMSVLGRNITNHFALIVDRPRDVVCLIGQGHRYGIVAE